ncbi:DUF6686 family protein [Mangrovibacterium lignilyticum]|uniref:DUF6686 family protein n=1 Tax=Mangrovibacterium lignilyticum TaxID=2668052 RepID=UPI0013D81966|nr:DUF6686 family protein [Mangrovibacterium lignilyticum]
MKRETLNGKLFICSSCQKIHLEFITTGLDFRNQQSLKEMLVYLNGVKATSDDSSDQNMPYRRKIMIPFQDTNLKMLLTPSELDELTQLIAGFIAQLNGETSVERQKNIPMKLFNGISSIQLN